QLSRYLTRWVAPVKENVIQPAKVRLSARRIADLVGGRAVMARGRFRAMFDPARWPFPAIARRLFAAAVAARRTPLCEEGCGPHWVLTRARASVTPAH